MGHMYIKREGRRHHHHNHHHHPHTRSHPHGNEKDSQAHHDTPNGQNGETTSENGESERDYGPLTGFVDYWLPRDGRVRSFAKYCPLIAATFAPFSTLMDIPALSERWYYINGISQRDEPTCIALSAIGLALNLIANILLIVRFSANTKVWLRYSTMFSTVLWMGKTAVAVLNLSIFGTLISRKPGYSFSEGFWCGVVSVIVAGIISLALVLHYTIGHDFGEDEDPMDSIDVRMEGKKFMRSVTLFMVILGFQSLAFSRLEQWSYSDAIYFSTQTALTIGYGDLLPTNTAAKILVFVFSVLTISQLGNEIALIISFISARAEVRRDKWRQRYEGAMHREANNLRPKATLLEEMALIYEINTREELMNQMVDLIWSAISLIIFWVVGATIFSQLEGWSYGNAVYAVMVLSLTIGFGDFTPETPAGRVVFIVYALMAVPIVTSFAVQTITGLLSTYSSRGEIRERFRRDRHRNPQAFLPHSDHILHAHESYGEMRARLLGEEAKIVPHDEDPTWADRKERLLGPDKTRDSDTTAVDERGEEGRDSASPSPSLSEGNKKKSRKHGKEPMDHKAASEAGRKKFGDRLTLPSTHNSGWREFIQSEQKRSEASDAPLNPVEKMVQHAHQQVEGILDRRRSRSRVKQLPMDQASTKEMLDDEEQAQELESALMKKLMQLIIQLEAEARQMMLDSMDKGVARTLLLADRNVQQRDVRALRGDEADMIAIWQGEEEKKDQFRHDHPNASTSLDLLSQVSRYRNTFASILVLGSILQKLSGDEVNTFERWRGQTPPVSDSPARMESPTRMSYESQAAQEEGGAEMERDDRRVKIQIPGRHGKNKSGRRKSTSGTEMDRDIEALAEDNFSGITKLMVRQHTRQLRKTSTDDGYQPSKDKGKKLSMRSLTLG